MESILQKRKSCYVCGSDGALHCHHVFFGRANRQKSDEDGMTVWLCPAHHNMSGVGVHFNKQLDERIKQQAERVWLATYTDQQLDKDAQIALFIKRYGRNYIDE